MNSEWSILNVRTGLYLCNGVNGTIWSSSPCPRYVARYNKEIAESVAAALTLVTANTCLIKPAMEVLD